MDLPDSGQTSRVTALPSEGRSPAQEIVREYVEEYPPLPPIKSKEIRSEVFVHRSLMGRPASLFEDPPDEDVDILLPDNERLEHLGDAVVNLCATMLIRQLYPRLRVGPASKLRALIVGNAALARHTVHYGLQDRLIVSHAQAAQLRRSQAVLGDLFEAYVGGLFKETDLPTVYEWLKKLFKPFVEEGYNTVREEHMVTTVSPRPTIAETAPEPAFETASEIIPETPSDPTFELAMSVSSLAMSISTPSVTSSGSTLSSSPPDTPVRSRNIPLPLPLPNRLRSTNSILNPAPISPPRLTNSPVVRTESGYLSYLNQWLSQQRRKPVQWHETQRGGNPTTPLWYVEGWVENEAGQLEMIGSAYAPTKKAARNDVAAQAFKFFKLS